MTTPNPIEWMAAQLANDMHIDPNLAAIWRNGTCLDRGSPRWWEIRREEEELPIRGPQDAAS